MVHRLLAFCAFCVSAEASQFNIDKRKIRTGAVNKFVAFNAGASDIRQQRYARGEVVLNSELPDIASEADKAHGAMSAKIGQIKSELVAMKHSDAVAIEEKKKEYVQQLAAQRSEVVHAEEQNARLKTEIEKLRKTNEGLRKRASMYAASSQTVRSGMDKMLLNLTIATDFIAQTLDASGTLLNASETQIMSELDAQDAMLHQRSVRAKHMKSIGLLQVPSPATLLQDLLVSFEGLKEQRVVTMNNLKVMFERQIRAGAERLEALHNEYKQLTATLDAESELRGKLTAALHRLESTYEELLRRKKSLSVYLHTVGNRSVSGVVA